MAEAIARRDAGDVIEPSSAGLTPLGRVEALTLQTLANNGYSTEGLESKPVLVDALETADIVVNMSGHQGGIAFQNSAKVEDWYVEDPYGAERELYQRIFQDIRRRVGDLAGRLRNGVRTGPQEGGRRRKSVSKR